MNISDERHFYSYKSLFKINFKIYELGEWKLPRPIPLDGLLMWIIFCIPLYPVANLLKPEHPYAMSAILSWGVVYSFLKIDVQGKFMPLFFLDLVSFMFRHKITNFAGNKINLKRKDTVYWEIGEVVKE